MANSAEHPVTVYLHFLENLSVEQLREEARAKIYDKDENLTTRTTKADLCEAEIVCRFLAGRA